MPLDLSILNIEQLNAVEELEGPSMIIAGAGSGKTRVLTYKIANLIESGVSPFEILALTFTNKAANEMKERIISLVSGEAEKVWMGTFHSISARLLRMEAEKIGFSRNYSIYDTIDSANLIKQVMLDNNISTEKMNPKGVQASISFLKNKLILPSEYSTIAKTHYERIIEKIYPQYQTALSKNNAMDFDDLLMKPIELFEKFPEVLEKYQNRFKYILVDEYQDTNRAQYIFVKMLAEKNKNVSVVGDDAQSIYKWRGAEIQNIFDFENDFPFAKIFRLEQNYRSTQKILTFAGFIIKNNKKQIEKNLWTENENGEEVHIVETLTDKEEANKVAKYISNEIHKRKLKFSDFAVLYRTNAQSRVLEESLRQNGMPYIIVGGIRFYQRKEIKDILCNLRIIVNPSDDEAMIRSLNLKEGIGKTSVEKLTGIAKDRNIQIFEAIKLVNESSVFTGRIKNILTAQLNFIYKYFYLKDGIKLSEVVRGVIDEMGILKELRLENTLESEERSNNINELISAVAEFEDTTENATLESFLEQVSLVADIDEVDNKKNAITLMTIHASKGLEFPVILITGLEENLFPGNNSINSEEELEEERRLFYVAVTRAKEKLYITYTNQRYRFGIQQFQVKSRFLREISDKVKNSDIAVYENLKSLRSKRTGYSLDKPKPASIGITYEYLASKKQKKENEYDDKFPDVRKGVNVFHDSFGKGVVLSVNGFGINKKANILFNEMGLKTIHLKFAKMRVEVDS